MHIGADDHDLLIVGEIPGNGPAPNLREPDLG